MFAAAPASAQTASGTGAFTESPNAALSRNLRSLAANPKSVTALMGAGKAALELGDPQAALTFFARAEEQMPRDGRVKMWIASALVQLQQPHAALKFFRDATDLGVPAAEVARERGLANDIAGNPREAQRDYRLALQKGRDDEATRRLALSLAISGEREPALRLLEDQLLVRDRAAERARALILALTGDAAGAARAVQAAMPGQAGAMSPFLARLPSLSPADRALAVHLGVFPRDGRTGPPTNFAANDFAAAVTDAGRPDPSQGSLARRSAPPPEPASADGRRGRGSEGGLAPAVRRTTAATPTPVAKAPAEERLAGVRRRKASSRSEASPGFAASNSHWAMSRGLDVAPSRRKPESRTKPDRTPPVQTADRTETTTAQLVAQAPASATQEIARPSTAIVSSAPLPQFQLQPGSGPKPAQTEIAAAAPSPAPLQPQPQFELQPKPAEIRIAAVEPSAPPPQSEPVPPGSRLADLSAAIADIGEAEPARTEAAKAKPAAAAAKKPKPSAPAEPSRAWVQIAVGAAKTGLPGEYARLKAKAPKLLGAHGAWTAPLNSTNRLLVGPFASAKEAQAFVNQLKAQDLSGFAWTSAAGQKVEKLPAK
ncbi:MAG TPA: SPOR domain-containing protein [Allosphingosinicella sp.]|jgi:tetratricopeptide (TPR) repeat protein